MAKGRGTSATILLFCMMVFYFEMVHAHTYVVGDEDGWTLDVGDWPDGKSFKVGDVLEFNYSPSSHNVVVVDEVGYNSCNASASSKTYHSGNDHIQLVHGSNYFICTFLEHCVDGMNIVVNAV
ncbi:Basic blue protein [Spatholobus suberectus]|nr:Basic blue protein [Spatholobus suberectus]